MIYILHGPDTYSLSRELDSIKGTLGNDDMLQMNTAVLDGKQLTSRELIDACSSVPFLAPVRLIIVEGLFERFEDAQSYGKTKKKTQGGAKKDVQPWQEFIEFVPAMPPTTVVVFCDGKLSEKNKLFNQLHSFAKIKSFPQPSVKQLHSWIHTTVRQRESSISEEAVDLLIQFIGPDLWSMSNEIDKIITFKNKQAITLDDVKELTCYVRETSIFNLVDAVIAGDESKAELLLDNLLKHGTAPAYILTMIARQFRIILMAHELHGKVARQKLMQKLSIRSDYIFDRVVRQARLYELERLHTVYNSILDTDIAIKTGRYHEDLAIVMLIAELCRH